MRHALLSWPLAAAASLLIGLAACTSTQVQDTAASPAARSPLFDRVGGKPGLAAVVDGFMLNAAVDPRIARRFRDADTPRFKAALAERLCVSIGGPCRDTGRPMKTVHAGMGISDAEFNAMTQDLRRAMSRHDIPVDTQLEFVAALEPLRDDVVSPYPPTRSVVGTQVVHPAAANPAGGKKAVAKKPAVKKQPAAKKAPAKKPPAQPDSNAT